MTDVDPRGVPATAAVVDALDATRDLMNTHQAALRALQQALHAQHNVIVTLSTQQDADRAYQHRMVGMILRLIAGGFALIGLLVVSNLARWFGG